MFFSELKSFLKASKRRFRTIETFKTLIMTFPAIPDKVSETAFCRKTPTKTPSENRTRNSDVKTGPLRHIVVKVSYQKEKKSRGPRMNVYTSSYNRTA